MKKTVAFVVLTAILLSACSCKNTESPPSESESDTITTSTVTSGTTTEAVPDTESEQSDPGDTTESNMETSADDTEPVETTPLSSEPIVSSSPVTDPPATDPPVTDPPVTDPPITNVPDPTPSLLFKDPYFKKGVNYSRLDVAVKKGRLSYSTGSPTWLYSQEMSKYDISDGKYTSPEDGVHIYEDTSKYLLLNTNTGFFRMGIKERRIYRPENGRSALYRSAHDTVGYRKN